MAAELDAGAVPIVVRGRGARRGLGRLAPQRRMGCGFARVSDAVPAGRVRLLTDATTSGGLLVAVDPARAGELPGAIVGRLVAGEPGAIAVLA